jgi:hypothetical protein
VALTLALEEGTHVREREKLALPSHDALTLDRCANRLLQRLRVHHGISSVSLTVSDIDAAGGLQLALLDNYNNAGFKHEREQALAGAINYVRRRLGAQAMTTAALHLPSRSTAHLTPTLAKRYAVPVAVTADNDGSPLRWRRTHGKTAPTEFQVTRIVDHWRLGDWLRDVDYAHCYRVETWPPGLYDLQRQGTHWQLQAVAD